MSDKNQNVVVLQEPEEVIGPRRWTFHRYLKGIVFAKWATIGATVVLGVGGYLAGKFLINPLLAKHTATFSYENVAIASDKVGGGDYVDGSKFSYASLITEPTIAKVKAGNEKYKNLDATKIAGGISIGMESYKNNDGAIVYTTPNKFTITVKANVFTSTEIARSFVNDLIETANVTAMNAVKTHRVNSAFPSNFDSLSFKQQLNLIGEERNRIVSEINALATTFTTQGIIDEQGTLISTLQSDISYAFSEQGVDRLTSMREMVDSYEYYNYDENNIQEAIDLLGSIADGRIETLRIDCDAEVVKKELVTEMKAATGGMIVTESQYANLIAQYEKEIADIGTRRLAYLEELMDYGYDVSTFKADPKVENIPTIVLDGTSGIQGRLIAIRDGTADEQTKAWAAKNTAFKQLVAKEKAKVLGENSYAEKAQNAYQYLYKTKKSEVTYYNSGIIATSGSLPSVLFAAAGAVVGFAAASLIGAAIYIHKIDPIIDEKEIAKKEEAKAE